MDFFAIKNLKHAWIWTFSALDPTFLDRRDRRPCNTA